jgi:ribosomal-protein-alanine N-acetyltransferase
MNATTIQVHTRWMIRRDMPAVLAIERDVFDCPWSEVEFRKVLGERNCIGVVAEYDGRVVGYMIYELYKTRIHVLNFSVAADFQRCGVGRQMVAKLVSKLSAKRRWRIVLEVRETNLPAQLFFRTCGFRAVAVLHGFFDNGEDEYLMLYRLRSEA